MLYCITSLFVKFELFSYSKIMVYFMKKIPYYNVNMNINEMFTYEAHNFSHIECLLIILIESRFGGNVTTF